MSTGRREWSCPICCEEPGDIAHALPCRHHFCLGCILRWLRGNRTCPVCRRMIATISFSEQEEDFLQCIVRQPEQAAAQAGSDGSGPRGPAAPSAPAPAEQGPEPVGGILPELWAELFRRRRDLLDPVRSWLRQWLQRIYGERWWQVMTAESSILLALCIFGPDREVLVRQLRPRLRHHTPPLVRGVLSIVETQCSQEVRRLRRCRAARDEAESTGAGSGR